MGDIRITGQQCCEHMPTERYWIGCRHFDRIIEARGLIGASARGDVFCPECRALNEQDVSQPPTDELVILCSGCVLAHWPIVYPAPRVPPPPRVPRWLVVFASTWGLMRWPLHIVPFFGLVVLFHVVNAIGVVAMALGSRGDWVLRFNYWALAAQNARIQRWKLAR
jgi:hypothetical protein